jgi:quercetin dioxygenase-like cupin family protein
MKVPENRPGRQLIFPRLGPMRNRTKTVGSFLVFIALAALWATRATAASSPASAGVVRVLSQQPRAGQAGIDITVLTVDYPPGGTTSPHEHPGTTYAYVLEGAVVSKLDDGPTQTFTKGQMWTEQPHDHHMISKNASSTEPAKLLVLMIAPHGAQLTTFLH